MKILHATTTQINSSSSNVYSESGADVTNIAPSQCVGLHLPVQITIPGTPATMSGFIEEITPGAASLIVECLITQETVIRVDYNNTILDGEVIWCRPDAGFYRMNVLIYEGDASGQRRSPRFPVILEARIHIRGAKDVVKGQIVDISSDGLGIEMPISLRIGDTIAIETESCTTFGLVRYSRRIKDEACRVGISMQYVMPKRRKHHSNNGRPFIRFWTALAHRGD